MLNEKQQQDVEYQNDHSPERKGFYFLFFCERLDSNGRMRTKGKDLTGSQLGIEAAGKHGNYLRRRTLLWEVAEQPL